MQDARNRVLSPGDIVLIPCRILTIHPDSDIDIDVKTLGAQEPNGFKTNLSLNSKQVLKGNATDYPVSTNGILY